MQDMYLYTHVNIEYRMGLLHICMGGKLCQLS